MIYYHPICSNVRICLFIIGNFNDIVVRDLQSKLAKVDFKSLLSYSRSNIQGRISNSYYLASELQISEEHEVLYGNSRKF